MRTRECWACHRIGTRQYVESTNGTTGWECTNDRACTRRQAQAILRTLSRWGAGDLCLPITSPGRKRWRHMDTVLPSPAYL